MAKQDMRIDVDFVDHPKTKRLIRMTGHEGFYCLMKLFSIAAKIYKRGELKNCDAADIEDITGWTGEQGKLVEAMLDAKIGFLEKKGNLYVIHDWDINQPWIYGFEDRSQIARQNAMKRDYSKQSASRLDANGMPIASKQQAKSNAPSPSPSPSPSLRNPLTPLAGGNGPAKKQKQYITDQAAQAVIAKFTENSEYANELVMFVNHRRQTKKPMTPLALEKTLKMLGEKLNTDQERIDCIELSIANGWQGVFPEKVSQQRAANRQKRFSTESGSMVASVDDYNTI